MRPLSSGSWGVFVRSGVTTLLVLFVIGCGKADYVGIRPNPNAVCVSVSEATKQQSIGRLLCVRGTVAAVCQDEGCWLTISDGTAEIRVQFNDAGIGVPINLRGEVLAEGVMREQIVAQRRVPEFTATGMLFLSH